MFFILKGQEGRALHLSERKNRSNPRKPPPGQAQNSGNLH